ncbi:MAG: enoyl-CoA hydratase/isomerase family protein [Acidimicrobiia bacterium]
MGVTVEREGAAAVVVMDYPAKRNAINPDSAKEIAAALNEAAAAADVCGVVLTGAGTFSSGGDLRGAVDRQTMSPEERRVIVYGAYQGLIRTIVNLPVPTMAAVDGPAIGMGLDMALACDSTFVGPDGWLHQGWGRVGLVPATGGELLIRRRNPSVIWKLLAERPNLDGPACEALGLAEAVTEGAARAAAVQRVEQLAPMSRAALEGYVELHRTGLRNDLDAYFDLALEHQLVLLASPEFRERVSKVLS